MGLFILDGKGNFGQGFIVSLKNYSGDLPSLDAMEDGVSGELPPAPDLPVLYQKWQIAYGNYLEIRAYNPNDDNNEPPALAKFKSRAVDTNVSGDYQGWENQKQQAYHACTEAEKALLKRFHEWLNSADFGEVKDTLKAYLLQSKDKANRILIESNDKDFQKMPWQKWDLLKLFSLSEVGLSSPNFKKRYVPIKPKERARVLVILGQDANIQEEIQQLATANIEIKVVTTLAELDEPLWNEAWDIIVFNGHSGTSEKGTEGKFQLSSGQWLSISDIRNHLNKAIDQGLKLAIFNSCDGLGLAHQLGEGQQLYLPQIMVMRDRLPMPLAPIFLQYFFEEFIQGISLYSALRATRNRLEFPTIKDEFPCASWLPVICQNPAHLPPTWNDLRGVESGINWREVSQNALAERQRLTTNSLTTGDGVEFTFDDIYVPLGLVEKVKKEKRPGEVSPEEGSQFYQPEEVTRTYKNDEFFAQVLKQGQSPKSQGRRLAVTGEPGAGKTTLLQKIAQWVAAETERDVAIWVSLADLQGRNVEDYLLQKWLKDALRVRVTPEMEDALALLFKSGRVWLLLDGVDEMGSSNPLATVANQISGWVASARVVVTCRQNVWDAGKNALEGFDVYRNLDFEYPEGVGQFIGRWFVRHPELGERLLAELAQDGKERIRDTVRNPLRLALLCCAWEIHEGSLPETKAGLYKQFEKALYEWKKEKFPTNSQQRKELNAALGRLALRGMEQSESRFRLREGLVTEVLGETDEPLCQLALDLGWLNLVGVAVENPDEPVYAFYHPTFQEYFAALAVDDWGYFLHHVPDNPSLGTYRIFEKQWKEVILLWFGRENLEKEKKEAFIEKLVNFDDGCGDWNVLEKEKNRGCYKYQAFILASAGIAEFNQCLKANEIIAQIIDWEFNRFWLHTEKDPIFEISKRAFQETNKQRLILALLELLKTTNDDDLPWMIADRLGEIGQGNKNVVYALEALIVKVTNYPEKFLEGKIIINAAQEAMNKLTQNVPTTESEQNHLQLFNPIDKAVDLVDFLKKLKIFLHFHYDENHNNENYIYNLFPSLSETNYLNFNDYLTIVSTLKKYFTDEFYFKEISYYKYLAFFNILWQCAQNLTYPEFYTAWHQQLTGTHPEVSKTIPVILSQLKPTAQSYPLPLDIQSLAEETDTNAICQELCTLIYFLALPDTDIPTVSNFAQLKQQILTVKKQLQKRHLALILHNCKPHPPLLTCCRKIADTNLGLHILWITDEPLEAPLRGFPPSQDNLLGAMQSWISEF
ncbi:NACHT domain-containing protein [Planktothricoides sp. SR001]|uniref:NACHT C-terminal alpha/beta 1 domain-containing protein n=1 Tax=Planktothricoides sp. SR001 TaxID=1705388 RepID=UPI0006C88B99|nr:NACHT domain-containing protein [Planktothricoides sp. SR001]